MDSPRKIVVVEDEAAIQQLYVFKLENEGFQVRAASDGEEGLRVIKKFAPDLILLDLRMPVMSGDQMLEKLRSEDWGSSVRVVILTNISKDEAPRGLRFLSVDRYIVKAHHTPSQIVAVVKEILGLT